MNVFWSIVVLALIAGAAVTIGVLGPRGTVRAVDNLIGRAFRAVARTGDRHDS